MTATAATIQLRPIHARDFAVLRKLNSPIWQRIQLGQKGQQSPENPTPFTATEACELVFQFSRPVREVEEVLRQGRSHFRFVASRAITCGAEEGNALIQNIQAEIVKFGGANG